MLITIISDLHDNPVNLKAFLDWANANKIEEIINLGDVCNSDSLKYLSQNFSGEILLVKGNAELYDERDLAKYKNIKYFGLCGQTRINNLQIGFVHKPTDIKILQDKNPELKFNFIFHGHTHKPWLKNEHGLIISNPGTLGGVFQMATFSILETTSGNLELKILDKL